MKKYRVIRNCCGFNGRYWREGVVAEFNDDVVVPRHFQLVDSSFVQEAKPQQEEAMPLSKAIKIPEIKTGFAYQADEVKITEQPKKRGRKPKDNS